jgi:hypothetical protein
MDVTNRNVGEFNTGYRIYEFTAFDEVCEEDIYVNRSDWWLAENGMTVDDS